MVRRISTMVIAVALLFATALTSRPMEQGAAKKEIAASQTNSRQLTKAEQSAVVGGKTGCDSWSGAGWTCAQCCLDLWIFSVCVGGCVPISI